MDCEHRYWWGQPPAILKGWIDRVIRPGAAYEFLEGDSGEGVPVGLLKARAALVFNTANTPERREIEVFGDPLQRPWQDCIFDLCGVKIFHRHMYRVIVTSTLDQRHLWLDDVRDTAMAYFPADLTLENAAQLAWPEAARIADLLNAHTPEPLRADLAFVFGTAHLEPARIAADLFNRGVVRHIVLTGGPNRNTGINEAQTHLDILRQAGVSEEQIIVEDRSANTLENVTLALPLIDVRIGLDNIHSIVAVTKWYHARRALMTLKQHCPPGICFFATTYEPDGLPLTDWHKHPEAARRVIKEGRGIAHYLAQGDIAPVHRDTTFYV